MSVAVKSYSLKRLTESHEDAVCKHLVMSCLYGLTVASLWILPHF